METVPVPQRHADPRSTVSVALGVLATGCAAATMATTIVWMSALVLVVATTGFTLGHSAHQHALNDTRLLLAPALAGQVLNIVALALSPCWMLVLLALNAV